jgi:hypothetical protein
MKKGLGGTPDTAPTFLWGLREQCGGVLFANLERPPLAKSLHGGTIERLLTPGRHVARVLSLSLSLSHTHTHTQIYKGQGHWKTRCGYSCYVFRSWGTGIWKEGPGARQGCRNLVHGHVKVRKRSNRKEGEMKKCEANSQSHWKHLLRRVERGSVATESRFLFVLIGLQIGDILVLRQIETLD